MPPPQIANLVFEDPVDFDSLTTTTDFRERRKAEEIFGYGEIRIGGRQV
jgi:hypothetical protein